MFRFFCRRRAVCAPLALALAVLAGGAAAAQAGPVVERISFAPSADGQGYVVRLHTTQRLHAYSEPRYVADGRLELVLFHADLSQALQRDAPGGPVLAYTVEPRQGHLYFQFQLAPHPRLEAAAYRDRLTDDLLLGLRYRDAAPVAAPAHPAAHPDAAASHHDAPPLDDARRRWKLDTIVIDAGHGGHDPGAVGAGGLREKDVVLPVARRLGRYLEELPDVRVVYTRQDDHFVTLARRGHIANEAGGKLFISIHANAAHNRLAAGAETYFLGLHKTDVARRVMERENSVVQYESNPEAYRALDEEALIVQTLAQSAYLRQSEELAGLVQQQFEQHVGREDRGVKQAGFYVLWSASMPAILVELGFVTNPSEAAFLQSESGQDYLASAIFRAVRAFKTQYEKGLDLVVY